jgi:hypothetical protein
MTAVKIARSRRGSPLLVCKKCVKRCAGGADIKRSLKAALKSRRDKITKPPRLVSTTCFGICPKRAVVVASGASLCNNEYLLVSTSDDAVAAVDALMSSDQSRPGE